MRITPLELQNHRFRRSVGGYSPDEVNEFLRLVAEDYEGVVRQLEAQREEIARLKQRLEDLVAKEQVLQDTLTTAQKLSEDLKRTAMKEAEVMVSEAEVKGEKVLEAAHRRAAQLSQDIKDMRHLKIRMAAAVRSTIESHLQLLQSLAEEPPDAPRTAARVTHVSGSPPDAGPSREL